MVWVAAGWEAGGELREDDQSEKQQKCVWGKWGRRWILTDWPCQFLIPWSCKSTDCPVSVHCLSLLGNSRWTRGNTNLGLMCFIEHTALVGLSGLVQTRIFGPTYRRRLHPIPLWMIATRKYENCRLGFRGAQPHIIAGSPGNAARHKCRESEGRSLFRHAEAWGRNQNSSELPRTC